MSEKLNQFDKIRAINTFCYLAKIKSPLKDVDEIRHHLLAQISLTTGNTKVDHLGNIFVNIPATPGFENFECLGLEAHMDTVKVPADKKISLIDNDTIIKTDGTTILGADDKAGLTAILETIRIIHEQELTHGPIQLLFTVGEELSMYGVKGIDYDLVKAKKIICIDGESSEEIYRGCASKIKYQITFIGKEGHGGLPESTINAILMAIEAVNKMKQYGIFGETNSFGIIKGTTYTENVWHNLSEFNSSDQFTSFPATNVVPGKVIVSGEIRGFNNVKMKEILQIVKTCTESVVNTASENEEHLGSVDIKEEIPYTPFIFSEDNEFLLKIQEAALKAGIKTRSTVTSGATHANVFNIHNIPALVIGAGCRNPHQNTEYLVKEDLYNAIAILLALTSC
ncbi:MAG: M20/M25/M40 family metallo-hydrolase [Candidatus Margulisiibacteriota bacterium]|jgi:tripeptide aminopeptidase